MKICGRREGVLTIMSHLHPTGNFDLDDRIDSNLKLMLKLPYSPFIHIMMYFKF